MKKIEIDGFLEKPKRTAGDKAYLGRFTCHDIQWAGEGRDILGTFTITAQELADAAESNLIWTDQAVQRGIRPGLPTMPPRELPIGGGYPDTSLYIFAADNADDMVEKLLRGDRLFLGPLIWNLRPGTFEAYWDQDKQALHIYSARVFLPDSHHRQQAILKAIRTWRDARSSYPKFSPAKQFKVELYFLSREDEGNYFFDKNQRPKRTAMSKAYDLTTLDDLSLLAKKVIDHSASLKDNVNRVTDRLAASNPQVVTLSTLREMVRSVTSENSLDEAEIEGLAKVIASFYELLATIRPELGHLNVPDRRAVRERLIVDSAVMMHGYAFLIKDFNDTISDKGLTEATTSWQSRLARLSSQSQYSMEKWRGDFFEKRNPIWKQIGVVKPGRDAKKLTVLNTGAARSETGRVLKQFLLVDPIPESLAFLVRS